MRERTRARPIAAVTIATLLLAGSVARADGRPASAGGRTSEAVATSGTSEREADRPRCEDDASASGCTCKARCCWHARGSCREPDVSLSVAGVRPSLTRVSADGGSSSDVGVGFAGAVDSYALDGTTHGAMQFVLGGGQAGFEGLLAGVIDLGYRIDVTEKQGPFGRAGFDGRIQGNDALYFSALELPRLTLGWQFASREAVLEVGARGGPILTGRFNPQGGVRSTTGAWEVGAFASAQVEHLRFEATAMRIDARKTGNHEPIDVGRGAICAVAGKVGICGDFMVLHGDARIGASMQNVLATYAGVTVGVASW